jgi:hypothetical protein
MKPSDTIKEVFEKYEYEWLKTHDNNDYKAKASALHATGAQIDVIALYLDSLQEQIDKLTK